VIFVSIKLLGLLNPCGCNAFIQNSQSEIDRFAGVVLPNEAQLTVSRQRLTFLFALGWSGLNGLIIVPAWKSDIELAFLKPKVVIFL